MYLKLEVFVKLLGIISLLTTANCENTQDTKTINVGVYCDYECSRLFQHNKADLDRYIMAMFWDANISFKTLTLSNIFFRVTSVTQINDQKFQPFIEKIRNVDGVVSPPELLHAAQKWFYEQTGFYHSTNVHVGIFITGEQGSDQDFVVEQSSMCSIDHENKIFPSTVILRIGSLSQNYCSTLSRALGITLGNPDPTNQNQKLFSCQDKSYIDTYQCGSHHHFFSKCADQQIYNFLNSNDCLDQLETNDINKDIDKYRYTYKLAPTIADQCRLQYNSLSAFTKQEEESCQQTKCYERNSLNYDKDIGKIHPISGTDCGNSKTCFRGRCIPNGYRLANAGTKKCLASSNSFESNDMPLLINCPSYATPLDQFTFLAQENNLFYITNPFSTIDANENEDKCLSIDLTGEHLIFQPCHFVHKKWLEWKFYGLSGKEIPKRFMLYHPQTQNCLEVDRWSKLLVVTKDCYDDNNNYWELFEYERHNQHLAESAENAQIKTPLVNIIPMTYFAIFVVFGIYVMNNR